MAVKDRMDGAFGRRGDHREVAHELGSDLRCTPAGMFTPQPYDRPLQLKGELVGMSIGASAAIEQPLIPQVLIAGEDLVTGGPGDAELTAYPRHLLPSSSRATKRRRSSICLHS